MRVLLVESDGSELTHLGRRLVDRGHQVSTCASGLSALVEIRSALQGTVAYRAVVIGSTLRDMESAQLGRIIESTYPDTSVVLAPRQGLDPQDVLDEIRHLPTPASVSAPAPQERPGPPCLHATTYLLLRLQPGEERAPVRDALLDLEGCCYALAVRGRYDLVALFQALDRANLERRIDSWRQGWTAVADVALLHTQPPLVEPELWPVLVDRVASAPRPAALRDGGAPGLRRDAIVVLELEPQSVAEVYVHMCLREDVVQCDATRDRAGVVLTLRDWQGQGDPLRVPDALRLMPGVLRARAFPVMDLDIGQASISEIGLAPDLEGGLA